MDTRDEQIQFLIGRVRDFDARLARIESALALLQTTPAAEPAPRQVSANGAPDAACLPALAALPEVFSLASPAPPPPKALPALAKDAPWEKWRAEWERLREFRGAVGQSAPPALDELWASAANPRPGPEQARRLKRALEELRAWAQANPPREPELAATLREFEDKLAGEYRQQLDAIPAHRHWSALEKTIDEAKANPTLAPFRGCLKKGAAALSDWRELMERDEKWWSGDLYDHKTALALTDVFDELNEAPGDCAAVLQSLEGFLNFLCVCRDTRLKTGVMHGTLPTELQNGFTDDKSNRPVRPVSLQKVARIKRSRWVRVDSKGAPVSELCKASYELV